MDRIEQAFAKYHRSNFVPPGLKHLAYADMPLPIGYGQTNSQPTTVEMMLEWLDVQPGDKVLDIGSGSGWTTALLSFLVSAKGWVYAVERLPELVEFGRDNVEQAGIKNADFYQATDDFGLPEYAPYDRILVSASADRLPDELLEQLKPGGKLIVPVGYSVWEVSKDKKSKVEAIEHSDFMFVPLI